ncbi:MAG TPA: DUF3152 domain-containing protein [Kineosporiaceae bacterium]|nr:DUF3152 domain-containing protein [Kineosporiaceae bacterium]
MIKKIELRTLPSAVVAAVLMVGLLISGCSDSGVPSAAAITHSAPARPLPGESVTAAPSISASSSPTAPGPSTSASPAPGKNALPALDRLAGLRSEKVAWSGSGKLRIVPGNRAAPGKGRIYRVRIEVEVGLDIDRAAFARFVMATLNDKRSWTENGRRRFARTDGKADFRVVLASPKTSAAICQPLQTFGKLSCRNGDAAVLTTYRWTKAIPEYKGNHDGYRHYVINHEVGHALGHGHEYCAGKGRIAPVMMQQTKGLKGCKPNPWPHP